MGDGDRHRSIDDVVSSCPAHTNVGVAMGGACPQRRALFASYSEALEPVRREAS